MATSIGYEYLKEIYLIKETQAKKPLAASSTYILPLIAMQKAQLAIDAYVDQIGRKVSSTWIETGGQRITIQQKLAHLLEVLGYAINFQTSVWQDAIALFEVADSIQKNPIELQEIKKKEFPERLKAIATEYPVNRTQAIAEEVIDTLLDMADISKAVKENPSLS